ncbi:MAG: MFS transporter [Rhodospirillaceae bacterium]
MKKGPVIAWSLFDFANSAFTTIIVTFVFAAYFAQGVAADDTTGAAQWSLAMGFAGLAIAIVSPVAGAIADQTGRRKPWLAGVSVVCVIATAALWFVRPDAADVPLALTCVVIATVGFEVGLLFYNAMLPSVAPPGMLGRVSGWGWALGYLGGLLSLLVALLVFVQAESPPFGLDKAAAEHVRATAPLVAVWFALFALPLFFAVKDEGGGVPVSSAIRRGLGQLADTFRNARRHGNTLRFLVAAMIYTDGVHTVFALGGVYAAVVFGMELADVILLGIALNVTAGLGAFGFAWADDKIGSKRTISMALVALIVGTIAVLAAPTPVTFWIAALIMSTFFGPVQAASRTMMARLSPPDMRGEMFGLFSLSGKVTAFAGPALVGWIALATDSYRVGMAVVPVFLVAGLVILRGVQEEIGVGVGRGNGV